MGRMSSIVHDGLWVQCKGVHGCVRAAATMERQVALCTSASAAVQQRPLHALLLRDCAPCCNTLVSAQDPRQANVSLPFLPDTIQAPPAPASRLHLEVAPNVGLVIALLQILVQLLQPREGGALKQRLGAVAAAGAGERQWEGEEAGRPRQRGIHAVACGPSAACTAAACAAAPVCQRLHRQPPHSSTAVPGWLPSAPPASPPLRHQSHG